jgi:uncharacterized protein (DUF2147 family)
LLRVWLLAVLVCLGVAPAASADLGPAGQWLTANGNAVVRIFACGGDLCGQIVGLAENVPPPVDWQGRPQCGEMILRTAPAGPSDPGKWVGKILDPRNGSVYHASIFLDAQGHLVLRGYVGLPIFGQSQTWTVFRGRTMTGCGVVQ